MPDYAALLGDIEEACRLGAQKALQMRPSMKVEIKPDGSIVTDADKALETDIREVLGKIDPGTPIWGEEQGYAPPNERGLWMIDPVDGTSNFAFGQPLWGVTVSYFYDGRIRLGVIVVPELDWTFTAIDGQGAYCNGSRLDSVKAGRIEPWELVGHGSLTTPGLNELPGKVRHIGSFVVEAGIFLRGGMRALLTNGVRMYDAGAGIVMAREIGAKVLEMDGREWDDSKWTRDVRCKTFGFFPPESGWPFSAG